MSVKSKSFEISIELKEENKEEKNGETRWTDGRKEEEGKVEEEAPDPEVE